MSKRLYRSKNSMIGGVCAGIAEYLNIDPTIIRVIALFLAFSAGMGIVPYIVLWVIIPEEPSDADIEGVVYSKRKRDIEE